MASLDPSGVQVGQHVLLGGINDAFILEKCGSDPRRRILVGRMVAVDEGTPRAVESVFEEEEDPEDAHVDIIARLAGLEPSALRDLKRVTPKIQA